MSVTLALVRQAVGAPFTLTPTIAVSEEYNDNVFFNQDHSEDFITALRLHLNASYQQPSLTAALSGGTSARFFARGTSSNRIDLGEAQRGQLSVAYQVSSRLAFTVSDSIAHVGRTRSLNSSPATNVGGTNPAASPTPVPSSGTDLGGVDVLLPRGSALSNRFGASASYLLSPLVGATLTYGNALGDFTDPGGTNLTQTGTVSLSYQWSPTFAPNVHYGYSRFDSNTAADANTHQAGVGCTYLFSPEWSADASVGAFVSKQLGSGASTRTGATFDLGVQRAFQWSALSARVRQGITPSAGVAGTSLTRQATLSYDALLTEKLAGSLATTYSSFDTSQASFQVFQVYANLSYPVWRNISAGLFYAYRLRHADQAVASTLNAGTIDGNIVRLQVSLAYPLWEQDL